MIDVTYIPFIGDLFWKLNVSCVWTADAAPAKVLVMQASTSSPYPSADGHNFSCIASPNQLQELPEDIPGPEMPFFRAAEVAIPCRSSAHLEELKEKITQALRDLVVDLTISPGSPITITITP